MRFFTTLMVFEIFSPKNVEKCPKTAIFCNFGFKYHANKNFSKYNTYPSIYLVMTYKHSGSLVKIVRAVFEKNRKNL